MSAHSRKLILLFALVNAALFAALLPLWEGFDEAYHYGYVEALWQSPRLPVLGRTALPYDVVASFPLAPVSHVAQRAIPEAASYDVWFSLPAAERQRRRRALDRLQADPRPTGRGNYEAHQPPLAYLLLAPVDWALQRFPLVTRVLVLRLISGIGAVLLVFFGTSALLRQLQVPEAFASAALFAVFCTEMLYATTAHVANDWLAVGLSALFFAALARLVRAPGWPSVLLLSACLAAGLLTKSYFPVFAGAAALTAWRCRAPVAALAAGAAVVGLAAGPWYVRNLALYGSTGGTPETLEGVGVRQILAAAPHVDWPATGAFLARAALWTGNNSFNTYSRTTLDLALALLAVGLTAWICHRRSIRPVEWTVLGTALLFLAAVAYEGCATVARHPGQIVAGPNPWYTQTLLAPLLALVCLGLSRWRGAGRGFAAALVALWAWILAATWTLKLFPLYAGGGSAPIRLRAPGIWRVDTQALAVTALGPAPWLYAGLAISLALAAGAAVLVILNIRASCPPR